MSEEQRIRDGVLFKPGDPELKAMKLRSHKLSAAFSKTAEDETEYRSVFPMVLTASCEVKKNLKFSNPTSGLPKIPLWGL